MGTSRYGDDDYDWVPGWRSGAPQARRLVMSVFSWREPGWSFLWSTLGAALFAILAALAPALLSFSPTVDMIAPIAEARAVLSGEVSLAALAAPLYAVLLMAGDLFAEAPGRIHLVAKAVATLIVVYSFASLAVTRFPAVFALLTTAALAGFVAAPFSGPEEFGAALFVVCALALISMNAGECPGRARYEGALGGATLFALWMLNPAYALIGFVLLSACPFLTGKFGLWRYLAALIVFAALAFAAEALAPGINLARAQAAPEMFSWQNLLQSSESAIGLGAAAFAAGIVIVASAVFGGRAHWRNWVVATAIMASGFVAAKLAGANPLPLFAIAAGLACFSVESPFYDGLFRDHDRASVAVSILASGLSLFWMAMILMHAAGQFSLQHRVAANAPENIRTELALVQPGGPTIAQWIEEGRFSTPEAREFLALTPVDQSAMLLQAAAHARRLEEQGLDVAFLTGADTACVLAKDRACRADGAAAATQANVVFVPRLDMDPKTAEAKDRSEALLYTQFRLVERTALWEIWVRRDANAPAGLFSAEPLYR